MMEAETKQPWEFKEEVEIMEEEEEDSAGALQTRERKKMLDHGHGNGGGDELKAEEEADEVLEEEHMSVFFDPTKGLWKCRHCDWTYCLSSPCKNGILNHKGYCHQIEWDLESLVHSESFYGSPNQVSDLVTEASAKYEIKEVMQFGAQNEDANETSSPKGREIEAQENVNAQEINHSSNNGKLENGSHSNGSHEVSNSSETLTIGNGHLMTIDKSNLMTISNGRMSTTNVDAIEVDKGKHVTEGIVNIQEYDLEKILDEQVTHDLYCPNCNSCITRRVVLKKRKRTATRITRDEPPKKPHTAEPSANAPSQTLPEIHEQESPDIFRCLSCFSFFIPTGCGFNIFRIFGRTEVNQDVQVQYPASGEMSQSENCGSWLLSCFQSGDSPKKTDADSANTPPLPDTQSSNDKTTSTAANTSYVHSHGTIVKPEQATAESSSQHQTTTTTTTTTTSATASTSSATTSTAASTSSHTTSATGFVQTEVMEVVTGQQVEGGAVTDATHLLGKEDVQGTAATTFKNGSFPSQAIPTSGFIQIPSTIPRGEPIPQAADPPHHLVLPVSDATASVNPPAPISEQRDEWDILKAIVYGGLVESVTSLSIVSAAAASGAKTLDIFILGIANLIGGLPLIFHNIADLRDVGDVDGNDEQVGHYWLQLGRRSKFRLHMVLALLSYILFGLLPPVLYGLSFRKSDNRENKMMAVAASSLVCIALLAIGRAHVKRPRTYIKTLMYYLTIGMSSSGLSYVAGVLITRLLAHFGLIDQGASAAPAPPSLSFPYAVGAEIPAWASF